MRFLHSIVAASAAVQVTSASVIAPQPDHVAVEARAASTLIPHPVRDASNPDLFKRKGGGGGGGKGGGGGPKGGGGGSSSGSSGSSGGSSSGSSGPKGGGSYNGGGATSTGSGPRPIYGGANGGYYGGGAKAPYRPGSNSPSGIVPAAIGFGAVGFLGAAYLYGAYSYPYAHQYHYYNKTTNQNETKPVECVCTKYEPCGCDDNGDDAYFRSIIGDGTYDGLNKSVVTVYDNTSRPEGNQSTILIQGGLPNGTTASGGTDDAFGAAGGMMALLEAAGWWPVIGTALAITLSN